MWTLIGLTITGSPPLMRCCVPVWEQFWSGAGRGLGRGRAGPDWPAEDRGRIPPHSVCTTCTGLLQGEGDLRHLCALGASEEEKGEN